VNIKAIVKKLPYPIEQGLKYVYGSIPYRFRYGKVFWDTYNFLQESQWWSREKLEEYQMQQLELLLRHAYENVPYYRRVFNERGLKPKDIQNFDDFKKLPYLTKEIVKKNYEELIADSTRAKKNFAWQRKIKFKELVRIMVDADMQKAGLKSIGEGDKILKEKFPERWWKVD